MPGINDAKFDSLGEMHFAREFTIALFNLILVGILEFETV
jgi:hypothetical protein